MPDREKTIKGLEHLSEWLFHLYQVVCDGDAPDYYDAYKTVDDAIDLLTERKTIVRCGDCKYYKNGFCYNPNTYDDVIMCGNTVPDWFCADGKRREIND